MAEQLPHGNDGSALPTGWYTGEDGSSRYWTGSEWVTPQLVPTAKKSLSRRSKRTVIIVGATVAVLALVGVVGGIGAKASADQAAAAQHALALKKKHDAAAAAQKAAQMAEEKKQADEAIERASRASAITDLEASVKKTAKKDVSDGILTGPILDVSCTPLGGGSTDDLTQKSATFACFAANKKNSDGTENGYNFSATMNWTTGEYSWRLGT